MKTANEIKKEIEDIMKSINKNSSKPEAEKARREIAFLRQCERYLESNPRIEFINSEIELIQKRIENIDAHYVAWQVGKNLSKYKDPHKSYLSDSGYHKYKDQLKTLKYLL